MNIIHKILYSIFIITATATYILPVEFSERSIYIMRLSLGLAGFLRLSIYHPNFNGNYYEWLMNSPWKGGPLPAGLARLTRKDLINLILLLVTSYIVLPIEVAFEPIFCFLLLYNLAMLMTLHRNAIFLPIILLPYYFLSGFSIFFLTTGLIIITTYYQYLYLKDRKALFIDSKLNFKVSVPIHTSPLLPTTKYEERSVQEKILLIITSLSYALALAVFIEKIDIFPSYLTLIAITVLFSLFKLSGALKFGGCSGFFYRIKHFVLWDYKFDRVFIIPTIMVLLGLLISKLCFALSVPLILSLTLTTFILTTLAFFCGPSTNEWALTGKLSLYKPKNLEGGLG